MPSLQSFQAAHEALNSDGEIEAIILSTDDNATIAAKLRGPLSTCEELRLADLTPGVTAGLRTFSHQLTRQELEVLQAELALEYGLPKVPGVALEVQKNVLRAALFNVLRVAHLEVLGVAEAEAVTKACDALVLSGLSPESVRRFLE